MKIQISQGIVVTYLYDQIENFVKNLTVKEFLTSVNFSQSYEQKQSSTFSVMLLVD